MNQAAVPTSEIHCVSLAFRRPCAHCRLHLQTAQKIGTFIRQSSRYGTTGELRSGTEVHMKTANLRYCAGVRDTKFQFHSQELRGTFHFLRFETARMESAVDMIKDIGLHHGMEVM